jgi:hypothetical protein
MHRFQTSMKLSAPELDIVVITEAASGVGRATALEFARHGARLGLVGLDTQGLEATRQQVEVLGGEAIVVTADPTDPDQLESAAETIEETFGPIDIWINNSPQGMHGTRTALRRMRPRKRGHIVELGFDGSPAYTDYWNSLQTELSQDGSPVKVSRVRFASGPLRAQPTARLIYIAARRTLELQRRWIIFGLSAILLGAFLPTIIRAIRNQRKY